MRLNRHLRFIFTQVPRSLTLSNMARVSIIVRPLEARDIPALSALREEAWRSAYRGIIPGLDLERFLSGGASGTLGKRIPCLVFEFDGRCAGYVTFGAARNQATDAEAEIYELYLKPEFQGLGFGQRLVEAVFDALRRRRIKRVMVWSLSENDPALKFYTRMGARPVMTRRERFGGNVLDKTALVWTLSTNL